VDQIIQYLSEIPPDSTGQGWVLVTKIMEDLDLTREEVYIHIMKAGNEGLINIIKTLEPGPNGLLSVTINEA